MTKITFLILSLFYFFVIHERSLHWNCLKLRLKRRTWPAVVDGGIKSSPAGWGIDCKAVCLFFFCFFTISYHHKLYSLLLYWKSVGDPPLACKCRAHHKYNAPVWGNGADISVIGWYQLIYWSVTLQMSEIFFLFLLMKFITQLIKLPVIKINPV